MATKKSSPIKKAAKAAAKKSAKKAVRKATKPKKESSSEKKGAGYRGRPFAYKLLPYLFIIFALVLTISLVIVRLLGIDDGAGIVGAGLLMILGGLFGGGTVLLPLAFGYLGIKWCFYNVKWNESEIRAHSEEIGRAHV